MRLHGWRHPAILAVGAATVAAGFAQFGATTALGDVAHAFGETGGGTSTVARVGLSGTTLGIGLAVVRLASLASLPLAALADRHGRRRMLLGCVSGGLAVTALAALSPGYWWFVALFAVGRPMLTATNAIAVVVAAEETETRDRAKAIALMTAGYGIGAGLTALIRGVAGRGSGARGPFAPPQPYRRPAARPPPGSRPLPALRAAKGPTAGQRLACRPRQSSGQTPSASPVGRAAFAIAFVTRRCLNLPVRLLPRTRSGCRAPPPPPWSWPPPLSAWPGC